MQTRLITLRGATAVLSVALAATACGSSKKSSTPTTTPTTSAATTSAAASTDSGSAASGAASGAPAESKATGSAVTIMNVAPVDTPAGTFPGIPEVLKLYADYINDHGGVGGHVLKVEFCDDKFDPNAAAACGRKAVSDKVLAVVGTLTTNGDQLLAPLETAGIPYIGGNGLSAKELTSPISYPLSSGPIIIGALGGTAATVCKVTDYVTADLAATSQLSAVIDQGMAAVKPGLKLEKTVKVPLTATDLSSYVSATKGADCIITTLSDPLNVIFLNTAKGLGLKQKFLAPGGTLGSESLKAAPDQLAGSLLLSTFPVSTDPAWDALNAQIAKEGKKDIDLNVPENLNSWASGVILSNVASALPTVDAASLKAALEKTSSLDTGGITPVLDFTKPNPVPQISRVFDSSFVVQMVQGGKFVQIGTFHSAATG